MVSQVHDLHKSFHDRRESFDDDSRSGRPSTSTNERVKRMREIVRSDRRKCVDQIASEVGISVVSFQIILHDVLNMCRVCQRLVLRMLTPEQK